MSRVLSLWHGWMVGGEEDVRSPREKAMQIVRECADKHGVTLDAVLGPDRYKAVVLARHEAMYRIAEMRWPNGGYRFSFPQIGQMFRRDHTTVMAGIRMHCIRNGLPVPERNARPTKVAA